MVQIMNNEFGLIHIYCGDGKGKTSAATGLAIRAAGRRNRVLISRFLKNNDSGELEILNSLENIVVTGSEKNFDFTFNMSDREKSLASDFFTNQLIQAFKQAESESFDMLILDEINIMTSLNLIDEKLLLNLISSKPEHLELILTGRNPSPSLINIADYVSDIQCIKHPFNKGIMSRKGIEE